MEGSMNDQAKAEQADKKQVGKGQQGNKSQNKNNNSNNRQQNNNQQGQQQGGNKLQKPNKKPQIKEEQSNSTQDDQTQQNKNSKVVYERRPVENKEVEQSQGQQGEDSSDPKQNEKQQQKGQKRENKQSVKKEVNDEGENKEQNQNQAKKEKDGKSQGVCRLFKAGKCFYGDKCKFSHGKVKVGLEKLCKLFLDQGKCKYDKKCHFVHMTVEEWEQKYRYSKKPEVESKQNDISSDDDDVSDEEKEKFEYKSKMQLKKEKAERLAQEHKAHKEFVANSDKNSNKSNVNFVNTQPAQVKKDTKVPGVEYFDPEDFDKDLKMLQQVSASQEVEPEKKEKPWFDLEMIEALKQKKEVQNSRKFKQWIDYSRVEQGKLNAELNNRLLFSNDYAGFVKSLNSNYQRDLGQIMRQYMSSFKWIQKNHMFEIFFTPTCKKENLPINFDITEGYFRLRIALDVKEAGANTQYQILNTSIPEEITDQLDYLLNNIHQSQGKSIFRTLKYFDNNMEKIFVGAHDLIKLQKDREEEEERQKKEEEERQKLLEQKKLEQGDNQEGEEDEGDEEGDEDGEDCDGEDYDEVEDPYLNQNDEENNEDSNDEKEEEEEKKDPTADLDLNMHCSLKDLQMRRIAHLRVQSLVVSVKCKSCKYDTELTLCNYLEGSGESVLVNNLICVSCNRIAAIYCSREFICGPDLNLAFRIGSFTWHILDIRQVSYQVTCEGCNNTKVVQNYVTGTNHSSDCHACFKNLSFIYFGFNIEKKIDHEYLAKKKSAKVKEPTTVSLRPKKVGTFKQGEPLPKNGACSHYRHSCRFFRFPCCGKAFPCDLCHDQSEKHEQIRAKTMICGYCSKEQSIKQECSGCQKLLVRINSNSGYWEGGKGTRSQQSMSSRDSHKFTGLSKTVSRRKIKKENMQKK